MGAGGTLTNRNNGNFGGMNDQESSEGFTGTGGLDMGHAGFRGFFNAINNFS